MKNEGIKKEKERQADTEIKKERRLAGPRTHTETERQELREEIGNRYLEGENEKLKERIKRMRRRGRNIRCTGCSLSNDVVLRFVSISPGKGKRGGGGGERG